MLADLQINHAGQEGRPSWHRGRSRLSQSPGGRQAAAVHLQHLQEHRQGDDGLYPAIEALFYAVEGAIHLVKMAQECYYNKADEGVQWYDLLKVN